MQSPIFECSICFNRYNHSNNKPLILPCGHVYCLQCLEGMFSHGNNFCPADKIQHNVSISQLSCCYAILNYLPSTVSSCKATKSLHCKRHVNKKIKFVCEEHKEYLCTHCVLEHTGAGHLVKSYEVNYKVEKEKPITLLSKLKSIISTLKKYKEKIDKKVTSLEEYYEKQHAKLKYEYNKSLKLVAEKQKELLKSFSKSSQTASITIKEAIIANNKSLIKLNNIINQLNFPSTSLNSINDFERLIDTANNSLIEIQPAKNVKKRVPLRLIVVNDKNEVRAFSKRSHTKEAGRAHSTAREQKKYSKKHKRKADGNIIHKVGVEEPRHETLSPIRGETEVMIITSNGLEVNCIGRKENPLVSKRYYVIPT